MALAPLGFADLAVDVPSHICLFYGDDDELRERLDFLSIALTGPDQVAVLFGRRERLTEVLGYIAADHGRDIEQDLREGRIVLVDADPDAEKLIPKIAAALDAAVARGATLIRFLGFIGWGDPSWPSQEALLEFESKVNAAVLGYPAVIVCTYNTNQLPGSVLIFGGIETHPFTIIGTTMCRNPHYVPYDEYQAKQQAFELDPTARRDRLAGVEVSAIRRSSRERG
jgi:hypothetical protein